MSFEKDIKSCLEHLHNGEIILYPTDTVWALGCDATNAASVKKLYDIKKDIDANGMVVLIASVRDLFQFVAAPDPEVFDLIENQIKPTTIIFESGIGLANNLFSKDGSIALRLTTDEFCKHLLKRFGKPIVATTASEATAAIPLSFYEIPLDIVHNVAYTVEAFREKPQGTPSTILKWTHGKDPIVIRG